MSKISFEIEDYFGNTMMAFSINVEEKDDIDVELTQNCSHADTDGDYIFDTDNPLLRIQSDNIMKWETASDEELMEEMKGRGLL